MIIVVDFEHGLVVFREKSDELGSGRKGDEVRWIG